MRIEKLKKNAVAYLTYNLLTIIYGFIFSRCIINAYGSEVNGLVNSISKFLGFITFFEFGIGAVVKSELYEPLVKKDNVQLSKVVVSSNKFFRNLAKILLIYIVVLLIVYPKMVDNKFDFIYIDLLIVAISGKLFAQYYLGMTNKILLSADQKDYIYLISSSISLVFYTIVGVLLINSGKSIQIVIILKSLVLCVKPCIDFFYVKRNYKIDNGIKYKDDPLPQKRNGIAQHLASYLMDGLDAIILTIFSSLSNVSIYSTYYLVVSSLRSVALSSLNGFQSMFGEMLVKQDVNDISNAFGWFEWITHSITTILFGCSGVLIIPFVELYTFGITDVNYVVKDFSLFICIAVALDCFITPYKVMIFAANRYKQTQWYFIVPALIKIVLSILFVFTIGLNGIAIASIVALIIETIFLVLFCYKNIIRLPLKKTLKQYFIDIFISLLGFLMINSFVVDINSYKAWIFEGFKVFILWGVIWLIINLVFYREYIDRLKNKLNGVLKKEA